MTKEGDMRKRARKRPFFCRAKNGAAGAAALCMTGFICQKMSIDCEQKAAPGGQIRQECEIFVLMQEKGKQHRLMSEVLPANAFLF